MSLTRVLTSVFVGVLACAWVSPAQAAENSRWRVARVNTTATDDTGRPVTVQEVRILREDDSPVSLEAGLRDVGWHQQLEDRARPAAETRGLLLENIGRVAAVAASGAIGILGVGLVVTGAALLAGHYLVAPATPGLPEPLLAAMSEGWFVALAGAGAVGAGVFGAVIAVVGGAWRALQPAPSLDADALRRVGAQLAWSESEAAAVVARHNAALPPSARFQVPARPAPFAETGVPPDEPAPPPVADEAPAPAGLPPPPPPPPAAPAKKKKGRR